MEFVIFLDRKPGAPQFTPAAVREHVARLVELEEQGRYIAGGPLGDGSGGLILAHFDSLDEARQFAAGDPFVRDGYETCRVIPWEWSHRGNGHLGVLETY